MAETANIAQMAEKIAQEIFAEFLWGTIGPLNNNWDCINKDLHDVDTHPSDIVFYYDDPYSDTRVYINCDLKSYSEKSISSNTIAKSINNLSKSVECASTSENWQDHYSHPGTTFDVYGLLFIYNHDGGYDRQFDNQLKAAKLAPANIARSERIFVLGPKDIFWLNNVCQEIARMRGSRQRKIPDSEYCSFFHPQLAQKANVVPGRQCAATLESITSAWIILAHKDDGKGIGDGFVIFYRGEAENVNEFTYFIDFMRRNNLLKDRISILIKCIDSTGQKMINFQKASQLYIRQVLGDEDSNSDLAKIISKIAFEGMSQIISTFSEVEIGMRYDR